MNGPATYYQLSLTRSSDWSEKVIDHYSTLQEAHLVGAKLLRDFPRYLVRALVRAKVIFPVTYKEGE